MQRQINASWQKLLPKIKELNCDDAKEIRSKLEQKLNEIALEPNAKFEQLINLIDENRISLLMYAAATNSHQIIKALIEAGVDINAIGKHGCTALHVACEMGQGQAVEALLVEGLASIDTEIKDENQKTAKQIAEKLNSSQTFSYVSKTITAPLQQTNLGFFLPDSRPIFKTEDMVSKTTILNLFQTYQLDKSNYLHQQNQSQQSSCCIIL